MNRCRPPSTPPRPWETRRRISRWTPSRRCLERVPAEHLDWKPHEKSKTLRGLVTHLANIPTWVPLSLEHDSYDMAPPGGEPDRAEPVTSVGEALEKFDANTAAARAAIEAATDDHLLGPWTLLAGGQTVFTMPRLTVIKSFVLNHSIHHRAQLGVYLRLRDVPVPAMYGPTADEGP